MTHPRLYIEPEGDRPVGGESLPRPNRQPAGNPASRSWTVVRPLVDEVLESIATKIEEQGVHVELDVAAVHGVYADCDMLRRCILNLTLNALEAMPAGGDLVITSYIGPAGFELEIADSGPGVSDEARRHAFEPFFTTKSQRAGLGLSIVAHFVEAHGGNVDVRNCPEGGAAFTIRIPLRALEAAA